MTSGQSSTNTFSNDSMHLCCFSPQSDVDRQGLLKSGQLCLVLVLPDIQTDNEKRFYENPDRTEAEKIRTENKATIRIADRHRTGFSGKSRQKRDNDKTRITLSTGVCPQSTNLNLYFQYFELNTINAKNRSC